MIAYNFSSDGDNGISLDHSEKIHFYVIYGNTESKTVYVFTMDESITDSIIVRELGILFGCQWNEYGIFFMKSKNDIF